MLIGKSVITDWLAVAWERSVGTGKKLHFKTFCMGRDGEINY